MFIYTILLESELLLILKLKEVQFPTLVCVSDRQGFQVGSLSHMINLKAGGYQELPEFPDVAPDPSVRNVEVSLFVITLKNFVTSSRPAIKSPPQPLLWSLCNASVPFLL